MREEETLVFPPKYTHARVVLRAPDCWSLGSCNRALHLKKKNINYIIKYLHRIIGFLTFLNIPLQSTLQKKSNTPNCFNKNLNFVLIETFGLTININVKNSWYAVGKEILY